MNTLKMGLRVTVAAIAVMLIAAGQTASGWCGDGMCEPGEEGWCQDCGGGPMCGNGICEPGEEGWCPDCPMMMGACCRPDGTCMETRQTECWDGTWQGLGSSCGMCPQITGACCDPMMGICLGQMPQSQCPAMWQGPGSTCSMCPSPMMGACCKQNGTCMETRQTECWDGQWLGTWTNCGQCPPVTGACCPTDGIATCMEVPQTQCNNGEWMGVGTTCDQCGQKWARQPDGYGAAVWPDFVYYVADDFECTTAEPVRRIDVWGMWYGDYLPNGSASDVQFTLRIHANIPAEQSPTGYSTPGPVLWTRTYQASQFSVQQVSPGQYPGWYGPTADWFEYDVGSMYWKYSFDLYSNEFVQQGGGTIYWLSVSAVPTDGGAYWGWVTTQPGQYLYGQAVVGDSDAWVLQLEYPSGHYQYAGAPVDMSFAVIGPSNAIGACCDEMAGVCMETTQNDCHFMWHGVGTTCATAPCTMIPQMGACCRNDGTCMQTDPGGCYDGQWQGPGSSCGMCPPPKGACCMPMGECMEVTEGECWNMGGNFSEPGSSCLGMLCPKPIGACCDLTGGYCSETTQDNCYGMWNGMGTTCASTPCIMIPPMEGCCMPDGSCREVMMGECSMMGGTPSGSSCGSANCPQPGACCLGSGECIQTVAFACSGEWRGEGRDCQECQGPVSPCCLGPDVCMELTMRECMSRGGVAIAMCGPECPGGSLINPIPPWEPWNCPRPQDCPPPGVFELGGPSGGSYEPNIAYGYMYNMTEPNNALFTKILDFPTGFNDSFTIDVNDVTLGAFGPGQAVDFVALLGHGVKEFRLRGVSPLTDPEDGMIFPIKLAFNVPNAQFHMTPLITADMDRNEKVDLADYSKFASAWSNDNCSSPDWCGDADIDRDGDVDMEDLAIFADNWLWKLEF